MAREFIATLDEVPGCFRCGGPPASVVFVQAPESANPIVARTSYWIDDVGCSDHPIPTGKSYAVRLDELAPLASGQPWLLHQWVRDLDKSRLIHVLVVAVGTPRTLCDQPLTRMMAYSSKDVAYPDGQRVAGVCLTCWVRVVPSTQVDTAIEVCAQGPVITAPETALDVRLGQTAIDGVVWFLSPRQSLSGERRPACAVARLEQNRIVMAVCGERIERYYLEESPPVTDRCQRCTTRLENARSVSVPSPYNITGPEVDGETYQRLPGESPAFARVPSLETPESGEVWHVVKSDGPAVSTQAHNHTRVLTFYCGTDADHAKCTTVTKGVVDDTGPGARWCSDCTVANFAAMQAKHTRPRWQTATHRPDVQL